MNSMDMNSRKTRLAHKRLWATPWGFLFPLRAVLLVGLVAGCGVQDTGGSAAATSEKGPPPNVVLIVVDTLRADRLGAFRNGVPVMPELMAFADTAWNFRRAAVQATWTKPSVASILTGLYPETHKVQYGVEKKLLDGKQDMTLDTLPSEIPAFATFMKEAGYHTVAVQTNYHLRRDLGFGQGFDVYDMLQWEDDAAKVTVHALERIEGLAEPFFLYVHYLDPHSTYDPPEPERSAFGPLPVINAQDQALLGSGYNTEYYLDKILNDLGLRPERRLAQFSVGAREHIRYLYDGECRHTDSAVMRLVRGIDAAKGDTAVIVTSDHGEEFWEHGSIGHSKTVYEELTHVPLLMRLPGHEAKAIDTPVETIDILPTVSDFLGIESLPHWQGRSLFPGAVSLRAVFAQTHTSLREAGLDLEMALLDKHKLIRDRSKGKVALYDLAADPGETENLAAREPAKAEELVALLGQHAAHLAAHPLADAAAGQVVVDPEAKAQLEAMGYLPGEPPANKP